MGNCFNCFNCFNCVKSVYSVSNKTIKHVAIKFPHGKKYIKYPKLIELHKHYFNEEVNGLHNALTDVLVCFRCYYKMEHDIDIFNLLKDNLEIQKAFPII